MHPLVEKRTVLHMCTMRDDMVRKSNGENMVRLVLLALAFFTVLQFATREKEKEKDEKQIVTQQFLP
jgi:hypothetical protein